MVNELKGIQIIGILVGLYLILQEIKNFKNRRYGFRRTILLLFLWFVIVILFINPSTALLLLPILSTQDMIMSVLVIGILTSLTLIAQIWQNIANIEKKITELAQHMAITNYQGQLYEDKDIFQSKDVDNVNE